MTLSKLEFTVCLISWRHQRLNSVCSWCWMQKSLCRLWSWWGEDQASLDGTLGQRSWDRCRGTGGNIKFISHEADYVWVKSNVKADLVGLVSTQRSIWALRVGIKRINPGVTRGCAEYQYCRNAQKDQGWSFRGGSGRTEAGWGGAWVVGGGGSFWKPPLFSARSWHRSVVGNRVMASAD